MRMNTISQQIAKYTNVYKQEKKSLIIAVSLAALVLFFTTYVLIRPAFTLEKNQSLNCTYEVHQHNEDCFDEKGNVICGYADYAVHIHDPKYCYDSENNLICPLDEAEIHEHDDSCYEEQYVLICGQEENDSHVHNSDCYELQNVLVCEKPEIALHTHSDECYRDILDENGEIIGKELICGKLQTEEHNHTDQCCVEEETNPDISEGNFALDVNNQLINMVNDACTSGNYDGISWSISPAVGGGFKLVLNADTGTVIPSDLFTNSESGLSEYKDVITEIVIGADITEIGANAFSSSNSSFEQLRTVKFETGSHLTKIGTNAFYNTGLMQITIPSSVTEIGNYAFYDCESLTNVNFEENTNPTMNMGAYVFANCTALENINLENLKNENLTFGTISSIIIGNYSMTDGNGMFYGCTALKSLTLPNMNGSIAYLCKGCTALTSIDLDNCTKLICNDSTGNANLKNFVDGCTNLQELDFSKMTGMTTLYQYIVQGGVKKVTLPPTLSHVSSYVFSYNNIIEEVVFTKDANGKSHLTKVDNTAFSNTMSLKELELQFDDTASIADLYLGEWAFSYVPCLEKLTISSPNGLNTLGQACFSGCSNLQDLIWDVKSVTSTGQNIVGDNTSNHIRFTIGPNVEKLPSYLIKNIQSKVSEYIFTPNHSFYIDGSAGMPFTEKGCYYADENGNLYRLIRNNDIYEAELVYANRNGSGEFTVPATISGTYYNDIGNFVGDNIECTVTKIGSKAFEGCAYSSVTFANPENITSVANSAFAGAYKLSSINGKTTEEEIKVLLTNATTFDSNVFAETLIENKPFNTNATSVTNETISVNENENLVQAEVIINSSLFTSAGTLATGENAKLELSVSENSSNKKTRVYVKVSDKDSCVVPDSFTQTETEGIYYYDVPQNSSGTTKTYSFEFTYPDLSAPGKKIYVWLAETNGTAEFTANSIIYPAQTNVDGFTASNKYLEVTWNVLPEAYSVTKAANNALTPKVSQNNVENLSFVVSNSINSSRNVGSDYMDYVEYVDVLTLPEGLSLIEGLSSAAFNTSISEDKKGGSITAAIGENSYNVCSLKLDSEIIKEIACTVENGKLKVTWTTENQVKTSQITAAATSITYGSDIIVVDEGTDVSAIQPIENTVNAAPYYIYSGAGTMATATASQNLTPENSSLDIEKEWVKEPERMGEEAVYKISVDNNTSSDYTGAIEIYDDLGTCQYIDAETIQKMFTDDKYDGANLIIEIKNAVLLPVPDSKEVTAVDGNTKDNVSVSNTAKTPAYSGQATAYSDTPTNATITIKKENSGIIRVLNGNTSYSLGDITTIQDVFDKIGYVVTANDNYVVHWDFPAATTLEAGYHKEYTINATVKNSLQALSQDMVGSIASETSGSYKYPVKNTLYKSASDYNSKTGGSATSTVNTSYDLSIVKSAYVNGVYKKAEDLAKDLMDNSVIDYKLKIQHYGTGAYGLLPVVDHMSGLQAVLAPYEDNKNAAWAANADEYKDENGNTIYYILNKEFEYQGVYLENAYADSITVTKTDNGLDTLIKWYYVDETHNDYKIEPAYKAIVSQNYAGNNNTILSYELNNEAWANDLPTHRIYSVLGTKGTTISFKKNIVTEKGDTPALDTLWEYDLPHPIENAGQSVTYRLDFENKGGAGIILKSSDFYDILPETSNLFAWSTDNVKISYGIVQPDSEEKIQITYGETDLLKNPDGIQEFTINQNNGSYNINWNDGFTITYPSGVKGSAYIYVTLTFPEGEIWGNYVNANKLTQLHNTLVMHGVSSQVSHKLPCTGEAMLRKGVYETGYYVVDKSGNTKQYFRGTDRYHYVKTSADAKAVKNTVTYFVVLYNSGDTNLYLSSIYDLLPEGFEFYAMVSDPVKYGWHTARSGSVSLSNRYSVGYTYGNDYFVKPDNANLLKWWSGDDPKHMVSVTTASAGSQQMLTFDVVIDDNHKDKELGYYYLKPGEAIQFGYMCYTGDANVPETVNNCAMEYLDYSFSGVKLTENDGLNVSTVNGMSPDNNGEAEIWTNEIAKEKGFTITNEDNLTGELKGDDARQWLASSVTLTEGVIRPGITKTPASYYVKKDNAAQWTITSTNSGNNAMTNYTIEDTMEYPFEFTGEVGYAIYSHNPNIENISLVYDVKDVIKASTSSNNYLFKYVVVNDTGVGIVDNKNSYSFLNYGTQKDITVSLKTAHNAYSDVNIKVCFKQNKDKDNNIESVTMSITFEDYSWSIPADGYSELTLSTYVPSGSSIDDGIYVNKAVITPAQSWNANDVTQGKVSDDGKSIITQAPISIYSDSITAAYKEIRVGTDKYGVSSNYQEKGNNLDYILIDDKTSKITYTLNVSSAETDMAQLVLIDNLPQVGDSSPINDKFSRNSEFKVNFAETPDVTVNFVSKNDTGEIVTETLEKGTDYTVQYSDKSNQFGKTTDWTGEGTGWHDTLDVASDRSIRIIITKTLPKDTRAEVSFKAVIDSSAEEDNKAEPGEYAWNSFAYNFQKPNSTTWLYAAPLNVGFGIPGVPEIEKELINNYKGTAKAEKDRKFEFIVYKGDTSEINFEKHDKETIGNALNNSSKDFIYVTADVKEGSSLSDKVMLDYQYGYSYNSADGTFTKNTDKTWSWEDGQKYTIVEIDPPAPETELKPKYSFGYINEIYNTERFYSFIYNETGNQKINIINIKEEKSYKLPMTGGTGTHIFTIIGLLLIAGGGYGLWRKRKKSA